jgi:hypothetical protein
LHFSLFEEATYGFLATPQFSAWACPACRPSQPKLSTWKSSMSKSMFGGLVARRLCQAILAGLALIVPAATASAVPIITGLHTTGTEYAVGSGGQDSFWEVYAFPTAYTGPLSPGYQSWVFSGGAPILNVPPTWYPGRGNGGSDNVGGNGARWLGLQNNDASALFPGNFSTPQSDYTVIYRTTFQSDRTGIASFDLLTAADNAVTFFVGGTVDNTNSLMPTMTGAQIGLEKQGLGFLGWVNGDAPVVAGTNYLYAVVRDRFQVDIDNPNIGNYGQTGLLVAAVPEPSSIVLAALGGGVMAIGALRRRLKGSV